MALPTESVQQVMYYIYFIKVLIIIICLGHQLSLMIDEFIICLELLTEMIYFLTSFHSIIIIIIISIIILHICIISHFA